MLSSCFVGRPAAWSRVSATSSCWRCFFATNFQRKLQQRKPNRAAGARQVSDCEGVGNFLEGDFWGVTEISLDFITMSAPSTRVDCGCSTTKAREEGAEHVDYRRRLSPELSANCVF